jgi:ribonuclease D
MRAPTYSLLDSEAAIAGFLESLGPEPAFAIDLEADSLHSYREKICLVQISTPSSHAVIDPLPSRRATGGLGSLLGDPKIEKVLHGGDYDVRLLKKDWGIGIRNLFDTAIAAQFTGRSAFGLAALLEEFFDVRLDKRHQRADWSARPLSPDLLTYAVLDTAYLLDLRSRLREELDALDRLRWCREEFEILAAVTPTAPKGPWCFDVKGADRLSPPRLAVLQALLEVRERTAQEWDRPPFKVLSNALLLAWAESPPKSRRDVMETRGASRKILARLADSILEAVRVAQGLPAEECPSPPRGRHEPLDRTEEKRLKRLKQARTAVAERLKLAPGLLVNSATLERIARAPVDQAESCLGELLKRWQIEAVGQDLRKALRA